MKVEVVDPVPDDSDNPSPPAVRFVDVPVVDGVAVLPDGRRVHSSASIVRVPELVGTLPLPPSDADLGPGWWHPAECVDLHDADHNCLDSGGSIIGWREWLPR